MLDDCRLLFRSWSRSLKLESLDLYESGLGIFKNNLVNPSILGKGGGGGGGLAVGGCSGDSLQAALKVT